jgi:uncharacterized protein (DUF433 family)
MWKILDLVESHVKGNSRRGCPGRGRVLESDFECRNEEKAMAARKRKEYGQYIVADPEICHGQLTFKGTRIKVEPVLRLVARGMDWDEIIRRCDGSITREAILEAIKLTHPAPVRKRGTSRQKRLELGHYIVADPEVYHGQLTFKGTRIPVKNVLFYVAKGHDWDWISEAYGGQISHEAIAEAIQLACEALIEKTEKRRRAA